MSGFYQYRLIAHEHTLDETGEKYDELTLSVARWVDNEIAEVIPAQIFGCTNDHILVQMEHMKDALKLPVLFKENGKYIERL